MTEGRNYHLFFIISFIITWLAFPVNAQVGGRSTYKFLNLTNSATIASLGGKNISLHNNNISMAFHNPSLLNKTMDNHLAINYVNYFADINFGYASYGRHVNNLGNFAAGIHYINYGKFTAATPTGEITGEFQASEYAFNLFWSSQLDSNFMLGINIKPIYSVLERYTSLGIASDIGLTYNNKQQMFSAAVVIKNLGTQIISYNRYNYEPLPFEIQVGITKKLRHAPFRFHVTAHQLQFPDMTYDKPEENDDNITLTGTNEESQTTFNEYIDKAMRHIIAGVEIIPMDNFFIRVGYNYQRRQEMQLEERVGGVGFSWGVGFKIYKFNINYGRATYHRAGASNHFSLTTNFSEFTSSPASSQAQMQHY